MTHLWVRAEERNNEERVALMPDGVAALAQAGVRVTVEESPARALPIEGYRAAGAEIAAAGDWRAAPSETIVLGLKELPDDRLPLRHRHIMFGHAFKGQPAGQTLLRQFASGGGALLDLEYLTDADGRRLAAFGYWAGFVGAAVALLCWTAQAEGGLCGPVSVWDSQDALRKDCRQALDRSGLTPGSADVLIIGARGRVGTGAADLCRDMGLGTTLWDMAETAHGGPFPEVLAHPVFLNCIVAQPGAPVFVAPSAVRAGRALRVIGDIACDPSSDFSPVKVYDRATDWAAPARRVASAPLLDVMAIDNLPSLLPRESSMDFAAQLLPLLCALPAYETASAAGIAPGAALPDDALAAAWMRADALFRAHVAQG